MQVQFYGMFYKTKKEKGRLKKEGYEYRVPPYGKDETFGRVSNFFFWFLCAQKLSFLDHGRDIYALAWAGRQ